MVEKPSSGQGIIYLLENEAFESPVIKIGKAGRTGAELARRINQLNTGVPLSFTCFHASLVQDASVVEKKLHQVFHPAKKHWRGEFFEVEPWRVMLVLEAYEVQDMTSYAPLVSKEERDSIESVVKERDRKQRVTFEFLEIPIGSELELVGSPEIVCQVADNDTGVMYDGESFALSTLATRLKGSSNWLQGIRYWMYEGQTLLKRRDEMLERMDTSFDP